MKALILERKGGFAAALREDGIVIKTRQAGEVGDEIELKAEIVRFPAQGKRWMWSAVAAALAVVILGGSFTYAVSASAYVSLDVGEAGVELSVNRLGRVVAVKSASEDGVELAQALNRALSGKRVEDALAETVAVFAEEGYLKNSDTAIIAGITSDTDKRGAALTEAVENAVTRSDGENIPLYTMDVTPAERGAAREQEISGGRYVFERDSGPDRGAPPEETETPPPSQTETPAESAVAQSVSTVQPQATTQPSPTGEQPGFMEEPGPGRADADPISTPAPTPGGSPAHTPIPTQDSVPAAAMPTGRPEWTQPTETAQPDRGADQPEQDGKQGDVPAQTDVPVPSAPVDGREEGEGREAPSNESGRGEAGSEKAVEAEDRTETAPPAADQGQEQPENGDRQAEPSGQATPDSTPSASSGDMRQDSEPAKTAQPEYGEGQSEQDGTQGDAPVQTDAPSPSAPVGGREEGEGQEAPPNESGREEAGGEKAAEAEDRTVAGPPAVGQRQEQPEDGNRQAEPSGQATPGSSPSADSSDMGRDSAPARTAQPEHGEARPEQDGTQGDAPAQTNAPAPSAPVGGREEGEGREAPPNENGHEEVGDEKAAEAEDRAAAGPSAADQRREQMEDGNRQTEPSGQATPDNPPDAPMGQAAASGGMHERALPGDGPNP